MATRARRRRSWRETVNCELELRPLMNVFIVLIPMLLMSAVFMEIRVIDMQLPGTANAAVKPATEEFELSVVVRSDRYVIEAGGAVLRALPRGPAGADGAEALAALTLALGEIAAAHPGHREVRIVAEATTRYEDIVSVMDAARAAGLPQAALEADGGL